MNLWIRMDRNIFHLGKHEVVGGFAIRKVIQKRRNFYNKLCRWHQAAATVCVLETGMKGRRHTIWLLYRSTKKKRT